MSNAISSLLVLNLRTREVIFGGQFSCLWEEIIVWKLPRYRVGIRVSSFLFSGLSFTSNFQFNHPFVNLLPQLVSTDLFLGLLSRLWGFCSCKGIMVCLGVNLKPFNHQSVKFKPHIQIPNTETCQNLDHHYPTVGVILGQIINCFLCAKIWKCERA
jgi:hypothetical protein